MVARYNRKNLTWIDLSSPTQAEVRALMEEFDLHPLIAQELLTPSVKQKAEVKGNHLYIVLSIPTFQSGRIRSIQEIDFIVGRNLLITTRYESIDRLHSFAKEFERDSILDHPLTMSHGSHLLFHMVESLYREMIDELDSVRGVLQSIEERIFLGKEQEMVFEISHTSRTILDFRRTVAPHKEVLSSLELLGGRLFGQDFAFFARTLAGDHQKVFLLLSELRELLEELRQTNDSLVSTKQNDTMKLFTVMAFITLPLTLIGQIFGISSNYLPIVDRPGGFWVVIGIMLCVAFLLAMFFRYKKWL